MTAGLSHMDGSPVRVKATEGPQAGEQRNLPRPRPLSGQRGTAMVEQAGTKVFVTHRATGVHLIPSDWLEAWRPSGFREATAVEIASWYDERGIDMPAEILAEVEEAQAARRRGDTSDDASLPVGTLRPRPYRAFTLPADQH